MKGNYVTNNIYVKNFLKFYNFIMIHFVVMCRPACQSTLFSAWECFLQEVEADSQGYTDIANTLARQVSVDSIYFL